MRWILFIFGIFFCLSFSRPSEYKIEYLTEEDGLSHSCISCIHQDSRGFIWIGTEGGLNRYDGYTITEYLHDPEDSTSLSNNFIRCIYEDPADSGKVLWIGTRGGGLEKLNIQTGEFSHFVHDPADSTTISGDEVKCILKDKKGIYWIGTENDGLNRFNRQTGRFKRYLHNRSSTSNERIYSILRDRFGYLWLGTLNGLCRLDIGNNGENKFTFYQNDKNNDQSVPSNIINSVYEDKQGYLWVGTENGLRKFDRENNCFVPVQFKNNVTNTLEHASVWSIYESNEGELFIATLGGGLIVIDSMRTSYVKFDYNPDRSGGLSSYAISSICVDRSDIIWVGTYCYGVNKLVPVRKKIGHYKHVPGDPAGLSDNWISSFAEDEMGTMWVGTLGRGLNKFDRKKQTFGRYDFGKNATIKKIKKSTSGYLWIARDVSLTKFNPVTEEYKNYYGKHLVYHPDVMTAVENFSKTGRILASVKKAGNNQNRVKSFSIKKPTRLLVVALGEGSTKELSDFGWISIKHANNRLWEMDAGKSMYAGGAFRNRIQISILNMRAGEYELHFKSDNAYCYDAWRGEEPDNPEIWGISVAQLHEKEADRLTSLLKEKHFTNFGSGNIQYVYPDNSKKIWIIVSNGILGGVIYRFDRLRKEFIPLSNGYDQSIFSETTTIIEDRANNYWIGTSTQGLLKLPEYHLNSDHKITYTQYMSNPKSPKSLSSNTVTTLFEDAENMLWIGTDKGLNLLDPVTERISRFTSGDGLPSNIIMGIVQDNYGAIWISTTKGISRFDKSKNQFRNFTVSDGLQSNIFSPAAVYKGKSGELYFGGINGFNILHPDSVVDNIHIPPVLITDIQVLNESIKLDQNNFSKKSGSNTGVLILNHDQNVVSFSFAALDYTNPEQNRYAYQMEGIDPDWIYVDASQRFAKYADLNPGTYSFKVKGSNNDGIWNETGTSLKIIIKPPWWRTSFAYLIYTLFLLTASYTFLRWEVNRRQRKIRTQLQREKELRQLQEAEHRAIVAELQSKTAKAQKEKEKGQIRIQIAGDLHDEIGSNLSSIVMLSDILQKQTIVASDDKHRLIKISEIARKSAESMRDIVWFVNPKNDDMQKLLIRMRESANNLLHHSKIDFNANLPDFEAVNGLSFRRNLFLIYKEALNNIARHARASQVKINFSYENNIFQMCIEDNGTGFNPERVYSGNGLKNMHRRAEEMQADIRFQSAKNHGTRILLSVKIP